jgi:hypothetical protein
VRERRRRETQKQKIERLTWALTRVAENTAMPADKRGDLNWLRVSVSLAHNFALAGLGPRRLTEDALDTHG